MTTGCQKNPVSRKQPDATVPYAAHLTVYYSYSIKIETKRKQIGAKNLDTQAGSHHGHAEKEKK